MLTVTTQNVSIVHVQVPEAAASGFCIHSLYAVDPAFHCVSSELEEARAAPARRISLFLSNCPMDSYFLLAVRSHSSNTKEFRTKEAVGLLGSAHLPVGMRQG